MRAFRLALALSVALPCAAWAQSFTPGSMGTPAGVPSSTPGTVAPSAAYAINPDQTWINGAQSDAAWSGTGNGSVTAIDKALFNLLTAGIKVTQQGTVTVGGSVSVSNFPATQPVSGSVSVGNFPASQAVTGSVAVSNFPATQPVSGSVTTLPSGVTTTQTAGTTSSTAGTFTSAAAASSTRKGCTLQNTSSAMEYLYLGATASGSATNAFMVSPGGFFSCPAPGGVVVQDNIAVAASVASATYVLALQ